ncbi:MAG: protein kinase [Planctomycetes bacterium]|nr:protein kinase [Planctomycetota bacterium]
MPRHHSDGSEPAADNRLSGSTGFGETACAADSAPHADGPFGNLPVALGRYQIQKLLGTGSMGAVYLAFDTVLDRPVALKVAKVSGSGTDIILQRMETEAKAAATVDHPQICKVYDFGEINGIQYIALQYIKGEDLKTWLRRTGHRREPAEAVRLVLQMARALRAAHRTGVIHRDLKPANIMIDQSGEPVIMDFGLARRSIIPTELSLAQGILGTAAYMSPEQAVGVSEEIDQRSDIYALGVILFELLTGTWPFVGSPMDVMGRKCLHPAPSASEIVPDLPPALVDVCQMMVALNKEDRYTDCDELIAALESVDLTPAGWHPMLSEYAAAESTMAIDDRSPRELAERPSDTDPIASMAFSQSVSRKLPPGTRVGFATWRWSPARWALLGGTAFLVILLAVVLVFHSGDAIVKIEILTDDLNVTFQKETFTIVDGIHKYRVTPGKKTLRIKSGDVEFETEAFVLNRGQNPAVTVERVASQIVTRLGGDVVDRHPVAEEINQSTLTERQKPRPKVETTASMDANASDPEPQTDSALRSRMARMPAPHLEGAWNLEGSELMTIGKPNEPQVFVFGDPSWTDYDLTMEVVSDKDGMEHSILFQSDHEARNFWKLDLGAFGDARNFDLLPFLANAAPWQSPARRFLAARLHGQYGTWYRAKIEVRGPSIRVFVDDRLVAMTSEDQLSRGRVGVRSWNAGQARWRNCEVRSPDGVLLWKGWPPIPSQSQPPKSLAFQEPGFAEWLAEASSGNADQQVAAVTQKLKELNPAFDGSTRPTLQDHIVTGFEFPSDTVTDISPVRAFAKLQHLSIVGAYPVMSVFSDLSPLQGMRLTSLWCGNSNVSDLSPLKGMPITSLKCVNTRIADLSPLDGMPLEELECHGCPELSDITPLQGAPLKRLSFYATKVSSLAPLSGMQLVFLDCGGTNVSDLSPLKGMPLAEVRIWSTRVSDLTPLERLPLTAFMSHNSHVSDLSPLRGMKLTHLSLTPQDIKRGMDIIRQMESLKSIETMEARVSPKEFWTKYDAGDFISR